jgi:hypothetical protein
VLTFEFGAAIRIHRDGGAGTVGGKKTRMTGVGICQRHTHAELCKQITVTLYALNAIFF